MFLTPLMRSCADKMEKITQTAIDRSGNELFPWYTDEEKQELLQLGKTYFEEKKREGI